MGYSIAHSGGSTQPLQTQTLEHWVPSWRNCLGIIRTYSFVGGGLSLGVSFEVSETPMPASLADQDVSSQTLLSLRIYSTVTDFSPLKP